MSSFVPPKKNDSNGWVWYFSLYPRIGTGNAQANPTLATGDFKIAIDDGAPANLATLPVVDADFTDRVKLVLSQAETNGDNLTIIARDAAGSEWCGFTLNLQTAAQTFDDLDTIVDSILTDTAEIGAAGAGLTALATAASLATVAGYLDTEVAAIKAKTDGLPSDPADQSALEALIDALPTAAENATQLLDVAAGVETGLTVRQALRLMAAVLYGKASGMATTTAVFRDIGDTKDRIIATTDSSGNRSAVTRDAS